MAAALNRWPEGSSQSGESWSAGTPAARSKGCDWGERWGVSSILRHAVGSIIRRAGVTAERVVADECVVISVCKRRKMNASSLISQGWG